MNQFVKSAFTSSKPPLSPAHSNYCQRNHPKSPNPNPTTTTTTNTHHPNPQYLPPTSPKNIIITRTNSQSKGLKKISLEKGSKQMQIDRHIKFAKIKNQFSDKNSGQNINDITFYESGNNILTGLNSLQDSIETIQQKSHRSRSKNGNHIKQGSVQKRQVRIQQLMSNPSILSLNRQKQEDHYIYWKAKAYEYLQNNMKLMQEVKILKRQNQKLRAETQRNESKNDEAKISKVKQKQQAQWLQMMRKNNVYYMLKIEQLQKQLQSKQVIIQSYNMVTRDQSKLISGDNQRINLMNKMKEEIFELQRQINQLNQQLYKQQLTKSNANKQYSKPHARYKEPSTKP